MRKTKKPKCPNCGSKNVIPIVYGLPAHELFEKEERGEIILGGCIVDINSPDWHCKDCGHEWQDLIQIK